MNLSQCLTVLLTLLAAEAAEDTNSNQLNKTSSDQNLDAVKVRNLGHLSVGSDNIAVTTMLQSLREMVDWQYFANKLEGILSFIEENGDATNNFSLVGSQDVYNADGTLKEVRTLELFLPQEPKSVRDFSVSDAFQRAEELKSGLLLNAALGLNLQFLLEKLDGDVMDQLYSAADTLAKTEDNILTINYTIIVNSTEDAVTDFKKRILSTSTSVVSHLYFNDNEKLLKTKSTIEPELFAVVDEVEHLDDKMVQAILRILVHTMLETEVLDDVPENMRKSLSKEYPNVKFVVVSGSVNACHLDNYFKIVLRYHFIQNPQYQDGYKYTVYGKNG